ncbi:MAG: phage Gp37/Gp68 family protein [Candidatus Zixiibacteriota bacterium]|nr:MAG: phage Gp37/Gp68 family protein [candidate division Zixibacteria bacterium]
MGKTTIEWTGLSWNPVTGCTKISLGCKNCYAERMALRLKAMGQPNYKAGFELALHEETLDLPLKWKKPQMIFVNSMSDLFHENVSLDFIRKVFEVMGSAQWHTFQVLTKRSERLAALDSHLVWPPNVWMGVSVENDQYKRRISDLVKSRAQVKFLSLEPLLGPIHDLDLHGIQWVIVGGESGPHARVMKESWVTEVRDTCIKSNVPFFFKQWGGVFKKKAGRKLEGIIWEELPTQSLL